ncbi:MAG: SDR family oxidoreductase [bacterium]
MKLKDEVAIITGGGRGIGEAIAYAFAQEGVNLVLVSRTIEEINAVGSKAKRFDVETVSIKADISNPADVEKVVHTAIERFGKIDILVNNAGIQGPIGLLTDNDIEGWIKTININLIGSMMMMRAVLPFMMKRHKGVIINMSGGGSVTPSPRFSAYGASKAALVRLTETIAQEVKDYNIQVNAIAPGAVNTKIFDEMLSAGEKAVGKEVFEKLKQQKVSGGTSPEKAAELAVFLASCNLPKLTGKLISAVWDNWKNIPDKIKDFDNTSLFTLRRIDERNFQEVKLC